MSILSALDCRRYGPSHTQTLQPVCESQVMAVGSQSSLKLQQGSYEMNVWMLASSYFSGLGYGTCPGCVTAHMG
jgi:hypothetical protein